MRACARVALASIAVSASFSLSVCAALSELKETFLRWVESQKLPSGRSVSADELPEATPVVPPEKTPKEPSKRHPQPKDAARELQRQTVVVPPEKTRKEPSKRHPQPKDAARKLQRQTVMLPPKKPPIPDSTEAERPEGTEGQSAPSQPTPRWLPSRWPQAPPPGRFSR
jgi:hypothetical protein